MKTLLDAAVRRHRMSLFWFVVGLVFYGGCMMYVWKTLDLTMYQGIANSMTGVLQAFGGSDSDITTPGGYLSTEYLGLMWVIIAGAAMILYGARTIGGAVGDGTMELTMTQPVRRSTYFFAQVLYLCIADAILCLASFLPIYLLSGLVNLDIGFVAGLQLASVGFLFLLCVGLFAMVVSSFTRSASLPASVSGGVLVVMWVVSILVQMVDALDFLKYISLFHYWNPASIINGGGVDAVSCIVLLAVASASMAVAYFRFLWRDLA
jgi:ABC-2 type transport system permease protein